MEHKDLIEQVAQTHPKIGYALIVASLTFAETVQYLTIPDQLIFGARLVSYALASWGSIELIKYYRAKRKSLNNGKQNFRTRN